MNDNHSRMVANTSHAPKQRTGNFMSPTVSTNSKKRDPSERSNMNISRTSISPPPLRPVAPIAAAKKKLATAASKVPKLEVGAAAFKDTLKSCKKHDTLMKTLKSPLSPKSTK